MKSKFFLFPYFVVLAVLFVLLLNYNKMELHLLMTQHRTVFTDYFFRIWTEFGANIPYIIIALLLFYRYSTALYLLSAQLLGTIFSFSLKHIFATPRPSLYFQLHYPNVPLPQVQGMHLYNTNSFPSGHTITAFAFFFGIALISKNKYAQFFCFLAATLVGFSRIYLSQHFAVDVFAGSLIGVFCAWICFPLYSKWNHKLGIKSLSDIFKRKNKDLI